MVTNDDPGIYQSVVMPVKLEHEGTHHTEEGRPEFFNDMGKMFEASKKCHHTYQRSQAS